MNKYIIVEKEQKKTSRIAILETSIVKDGVKIISHTKDHPAGINYIINDHGCSCLGYQYYGKCKHIKVARHYVKSLEQKYNVQMI